MVKKSDTAKEKLFRFDQEYSKKYTSPLIKWYQQDLSYEEKYKLGLLTPQEYELWQAELAKESAHEKRGANGSDTFWSGDQEDRENVSQDEYADILSAAGVDVSNKTSIDFDSLFAEVNDAPQAPSEPDLDEILANVNRDIHGGSAILSEEEIAALFAQANGES